MALALVAVAACGCIDVDLLDEMIPLDAGAEGSAGGGGSGNGGDNAPPATDPNDKIPPALKALSCASGERVADLICIAEGPFSASLRLATNEPAVVTIAAADPGVRAEVLSGAWSAEHHAIIAGIPAEDIQLTLADVNGNQATRTVELSPGAGPPIAVTEVYADPLGPEPAQEFVEIWNLGAESVDLSGWMIDDEGDANGDLLPEGTALDPGRAALLVAPGFDPACADDPQPAPGALIVYLSSSIGSNGLKNTAAESIELYDASGAVVSRYGGEAGKPTAGAAAFRILAEIPDGNPWAWAKSGSGGSTPGSVPTVD
jgi:hypothetical protein